MDIPMFSNCSIGAVGLGFILDSGISYIFFLNVKYVVEWLRQDQSEI